MALRSLNECLQYIGVEPFDKRRTSRESYLRRKLEEIKKAISEKIFDLKEDVEPSLSEETIFVEKQKSKYKILLLNDFLPYFDTHLSPINKINIFKK